MSTIARKVEKIVSPVYEVGGSLRDELRGVEPVDYDFATPHRPEYIEEQIRGVGRRPFLTGKRFGTIGVRFDGRLVEITTFRTERYREGSRNPEVAFVEGITEDLARRDFTINAIARRGGRIIDPFDGRKDIERALIRAVGSPARRFSEDPLRMLRAVRFAAQLGFDVEEKTFRAVIRSSYRILQVSKERWVMEMDKILLAPFLKEGLYHFMDSGLCRFMIPELSLQKDYDQNCRHHAHNLWEHTVRVVEGSPPDLNMRWAALLHDMAKPFVRVEKGNRSTYAGHDLLGYDMVRRLGAHLRWSKERIETVSRLVRDHRAPDSPLKQADDAAKQ
ncbi:MAG TPA: HD domain-containing protein [Deltaproteobacteria bacterium]|nr:HD domain-containing protein [Deltaproteobacteria bacterium]